MDSSAKIQPTKGCVLVVDGEPVNLKLMELVLTQQNFTVSIAENEIEAISLVTKNKYDVIVLDIVMPETEDYQVLKAVKKNEASKATPVVVCSELKDKQTVTNCIKLGVAEYIVKPFDPEKLLLYVERVISASKSVPGNLSSPEKTEVAQPASAPTNRKDALMLLAEKLENDELEFPAMPEVGFKIVHMMQDDSTSINKIAKLIEKEPGISAKIIKAGNSSLFAGGNPAMTPRDAIVRIGVKQSMNYVLLITNSRMYDDESVGHKELRTKLWRHSVLVAIASRITGSMIGYSAVDSLFAFGLLHDIGKILLISVFSQLPKDVCEENIHTLTQTLQELHTQFGAKLLEKWKFPHEFVAMSKDHHEHPVKGKLLDSVIIVGFANLFALEMEGDFTEESVANVMRLPHANVLKLEAPVIKKMAEQILNELDEVEKILA